jgi:hypothetical protein
MRELRRFYRKKLKKHRWFVAALLLLVLALLVAVLLSPSTEKGEAWRLPQVRPVDM